MLPSRSGGSAERRNSSVPEWRRSAEPPPRGLATLAWLLALTLVAVAATRLPFETVKDYVAPEFFPAPNHTQLRTLIQGAVAEPAAPGVIRLKQVRVERFFVDGRRELLIETPECFYHLEAQELTSASPVTARSGDDRYRMTGVGFRFVYRGTNSTLTLSNQVRTTIVGLGHGPLKP